MNIEATLRPRSWSYALTRESVDGETVYAIRELYYDDDGNVVTWTLTPVYPQGDLVGDLQGELVRMHEAAMSPRMFDVDTHQWVPVPHEGNG